MQEMRLQSLGREDPVEKEMATHCSILALENPMDRGAWWATVPGIAKSWKDMTVHAHALFNTLQNDLILVLLLEALSAHYFPEYSFFSAIFLESYVHSISVCVCFHVLSNKLRTLPTLCLS